MQILKKTLYGGLIPRFEVIPTEQSTYIIILVIQGLLQDKKK